MQSQGRPHLVRVCFGARLRLVHVGTEYSYVFNNTIKKVICIDSVRELTNDSHKLKATILYEMSTEYNDATK